MGDLNWNPEYTPVETYSRRRYSGVGRIVYLGPSDSTAGIASSDANDGGNPRYPVATFAQARSLCVTGRGDIIYGMENHAENIAASTQLSLAGMKFVGLGDANRRPTFTFTTADSSKFIIGTSSLGGMSFENTRFVCNIDNQVTMLTVDGANCRLENCELVMYTSTKYAWAGITTTANASGLQVLNCVIRGNGVGAYAAVDDTTCRGIVIVGGDRIHIYDTTIQGKFQASTGCINITGTATTNLEIKRCNLESWTSSSNYVVTDTVTGSTGIVDDCKMVIDTLSTSPINGCATFVWGLNYYTAGLATAMTAI